MEEEKSKDTVERLSDEDMLAVERSNNKRQLALATAKAAASDAELAEAQYKSLVLQLFLKYGLSAEDLINADGTVKRSSVGTEE